MTRALVLGGGVAGICAAFALRDRGHAVQMLEPRARLGGRAFSFEDADLGRLDNGPHVMLGCYDRMRALLRRIGSEDGFLQAPSLSVGYRLPGGRVASLRLARLPAPAAMPLALLRLPMGWGGRLRGLWGLGRVLLGAPPSWTLRDWIERCRQTPGPAEFLWEPLCRAVMNAEPEEVSARLFLKTLRQAFTGSAARAAVWIPRRPWGELVGDAAEQRLRREGVLVDLGQRVTAFELEGGRITRLATGDGRTHPVADDELVVSAMPWHALGKLLPGSVPLPAAALEGSPIVSVYFQLHGGAELPDEGPLISLVGGQPFHFLYRTPGESPGRFALLAGGCRSLDGLTVEEIEARARNQLSAYFPDWDPATPAKVRVAKEARATFVAAPDRLASRPRPGRLPGGPSNLLVCGDWTDCGLPSTLEAAAVSAQQMLE